MKALIIFILATPIAYSQSSLWKGKLTCISKGFMFKTKTQAVLSAAIDNDGLERSINGERAECEKKGTTLKCSSSDTTILINLSEVKKDDGIILPFGERAGSYKYYSAKINKSFSFAKRVRCRGPIDAL